jgi:hypothetical protein
MTPLQADGQVAHQVAKPQDRHSSLVAQGMDSIKPRTRPFHLGLSVTAILIAIFFWFTLGVSVEYLFSLVKSWGFDINLTLVLMLIAACIVIAFYLDVNLTQILGERV